MTQGLARKLSRTKPHRDALLKNLVSQLLQHGTLTSTHEKCKEASRLADRVINMAKRYVDPETTELSKQRLFANIQSRLFLSGDNNHLMKRLLNDIAPNYQQRNGGYTRVLHLEKRFNDRASQSVLELVQTPIINPKTNQIQKGNLKFWLLVKNVIMDENSNVDVNPLTLINLKKIQNFKSDEEFLNDLLIIKKCIKDQENLAWDDTKELESIKNLMENVKSTILPHVDESSRTSPTIKQGFEIMEKRPQRPSV
ncbi:similar to Saccharomyces cerevisiae YJL063C MRPL8 Mitochondrial ribosomal protein of the large subunit [Maudiozyma saulgeensis]|uniref:Similar to Saccharomyces cerevisiae YJL063C MRPL8 Mitochondrial ribosomal protein of the large subunit n=1 Tax=Maudiozyma saulgeensis TaxID=1789683 RepID=A0A1X7R123_9SACH|nr:similar to Saccharomyces cerevisiae YJL063C MRPL8 Mitochondrial ribosomal protein of the large subunit [Kazachstania saulgeensis]